MSEKHQCEGRVRYGDWGRSKQCEKTGAYEHEGRHFCKTHHPPTVETKDEARREAFRQKWDADHAARIKAKADREEQQRRAECFPDLLEALQLILPMAKGYAHQYPVGSNEAYCEQALEAIQKATQ